MTSTEAGAVSILLVDDTADVRRLLRTVLDSYEQFCVVAEARDGLEAIDQARDLQPDVVLLDLAMPRMGGLEALPLIRDASPNSDVVVLSAFDATRMAPAALSAGAVGYLQKGMPGAELVAQLSALLGLPPPPPRPPAVTTAADQALPRAAHELRSPAIALNLLAGELARPQDDPETSRRLLEAIVRQAGVIDRLTTDLLTASHAKRGALTVRRAPLQLRPELDAAVQVFAHQVEITIDCPLTLTVSADQVGLEQMLTNLISNAMRYGSPPIRIEVRDEYPDIVLRVVDHGPGVPDWFRDQLFDEYTRAEPERGVGTGIGLFVVRAMAEAHGGRVAYERVDGATAFCLTLPQPACDPS
ncbi:MAG TPA: HAMP domain-containing sensor histidine kinase [Jatrophihabitans sp.]|uniref:ATP-binding response regulator n=1 Tax=Jatrophihabitans sp. TaxID=1932789 RepID=UPI002E073A65|nr:HAMP domain-containing sensor histidine kinase [Jatrophihabitans sp.]